MEGKRAAFRWFKAEECWRMAEKAAANFDNYPNQCQSIEKESCHRNRCSLWSKKEKAKPKEEWKEDNKRARSETREQKRGSCKHFNWRKRVTWTITNTKPQNQAKWYRRKLPITTLTSSCRSQVLTWKQLSCRACNKYGRVFAERSTRAKAESCQNVFTAKTITAEQRKTNNKAIFL